MTTEQMEGYVNVLYAVSVPKPVVLEEDGRPAIFPPEVALLGGAWVILNERQNLYLVDLVYPVANEVAINAAIDASDAKNKLIADFRYEFAWVTDPVTAEDTLKRVKYKYPDLDESTWLKCAPDDVTYDLEGNEISRSRPTAFKRHHNWMGWQPDEEAPPDKVKPEKGVKPDDKPPKPVTPPKDPKAPK